jgi:omega-6 fatty acid desaturase (delta-12 desaturase)
MTEDQVFVPRTRSQRGLPPFDPSQGDLAGSRISATAMQELWEALGDSPLGAVWGGFSYLLFGWPLYIGMNASGQMRYPSGSHHFNPNAIMFRENQYSQIILSDFGIVLWVAGMIYFAQQQGALELLRVYFIPYLWVNHWLVLITFLQHTDPYLPHYRASEHTFARGALATLDRNLLGELGPIGAWIGARATHGISETHVLHHVSSKIPHYNAWEATYALRARLEQAGVKLEGAPAGWGEVYRVFKECKFVEDEGDIVFFKNAYGLAKSKPAFSDVNDSGVEVDKDSD